MIRSKLDRRVTQTSRLVSPECLKSCHQNVSNLCCPSVCCWMHLLPKHLSPKCLV